MKKIKFTVKVKRFKKRLDTPAPKIETPKTVYNRKENKKIIREKMFYKY